MNVLKKAHVIVGVPMHENVREGDSFFSGKKE